MKSMFLVTLTTLSSTSHSYQTAHIHQNGGLHFLQISPFVKNQKYFNTSFSRNVGHRYQTKLDIAIPNDTVAAATTILLSSSVGLASDRIKQLKDSGIIITLLVAIMLSNLNMFGLSVPTCHPIYDLCWSHFLPASLALILLSSSNESIFQSKSKSFSLEKQQHTLATKEQIVAVGIPFIIGSIGSILGCLFSASLQVWANSIGSLKPFAMNKIDACVAVGCLSASYIGGTVNFFAAARLISKHLEMKQPLGSMAQMNNLLSAMAAADLIIMAVYFGTMTKLMSWKKLHSFFPQRQSEKYDSNENQTSFRQTDDRDRTTNSTTRIIQSTTIMACLAWAIVEVSNFLENKTSNFIPGTGCAYVALFGVLINQILVLLKNSKIKSIRQNATIFSKDVKIMAPRLSEFCFYLLFAAIGTSANLKEAMTHGLACLTFASISLVIHVLITFLGSMAAMRVGKGNNWLKRVFPLSSDEICIASNAAIGGASTAAALAGKSTHNTRNLVISATFWGIVGYAISTAIGFSITKGLLLL